VCPIDNGTCNVGTRGNHSFLPTRLLKRLLKENSIFELAKVNRPQRFAHFLW